VAAKKEFDLKPHNLDNRSQIYRTSAPR
jgi:hypothetical protein